MIVFLLLFVNIPLSDGWLNVLILYILSEFTGLIMWNRQNITLLRPQTLKNNQYVQKLDQVIVWQVWKFDMMRSWPCLFCFTSKALRIRMLHWYYLFKEIYLQNMIGPTMSKFEETNNWSNFKSWDQSRIYHLEKKITWAKSKCCVLYL